MKVKILPFLLGLLLLVGIYFFYLLYTNNEKETIEKQYELQEVYAEQAKRAITNFFNHFNHTLTFLSHNPNIIELNEKGRSTIEMIYNSHPNELSGITRVSKDGDIAFTYPIVKNVIGKNILNQEHNQAMFDDPKPFLSDVFKTLQGDDVVSLAVPIYKDGVFDGTIALLIHFNYIAYNFLSKINLGEKGFSFLISEKGIELYCSLKEHVGKSIYKTTQGFEEYNEKVINKMLSKESGRAKYKFAKNGNINDANSKIVVYKSIPLVNTFWSIAVTINEDEVLATNRNFVYNLLTLLLLSSAVIIIFLYYYSISRRRTREIINKQEEKNKLELERLVQVRTEELKTLNESLQKDIVERKKIEEQLNTAIEKAEKTDKLKTNFLAQVSHEIRTPINTILSYSMLIEDEIKERIAEDLRSGFTVMRSAGNRLIRTIDLILNMSEIQSGVFEAIPRQFDICSDVLQPLISEYKVQAKEKAIDLTLQNDNDKSFIVADMYTVAQIFANLIDNAIKYTSAGSIKVICDRNDRNFLTVSICDTGMGISKEYIPQLFDAFSQEETGYTRKFEGNGLGLALVKNYCEINNAEISVESTKGKGSTFTVLFKDQQI